MRPIDTQASVWNTQTGELILIADVTANNRIVLRNNQLTSIPCTITVFASGRFQTTMVANTGLICSAAAEVPAFIGNQFPNLAIRSPSRDLTVVAGSTVLFSAPFVGGYRYNWNFDGAAPDSTRRIPGNVVFDRPGVYYVTLTVRDAAGLQDPAPSIRVITVVP